MSPSERNQTNTIFDVELKHITSTVESGVSIGAPKKVMRVDHVTKIWSNYAKKLLAFLSISIESPTDTIGNPAGAVTGKECSVLSPIGETLFNFIEGVFQHRGVRSMCAITTTSNVDDEKPRARKLRRSYACVMPDSMAKTDASPTII